MRGAVVVDGFGVGDRASDGRGRELAPWPTGDQVGRPERRRRAAAIEPMTCPPNALRSGAGVITLKPQQEWQGDWGLTATG